MIFFRFLICNERKKRKMKYKINEYYFFYNKVNNYFFLNFYMERLVFNNLFLRIIIEGSVWCRSS